MQVLGSGGPIADDARASSGYLVWVDGRARLLVDAGGGTFLRFAETGASIDDLDAIVITHLHVDHSVELPAFLKSASFGRRRAPLPLIGPSGGDRFPSIEHWLAAEIGADDAAYRYLSGFAGDGQPFPLEVMAVDVEARRPTTVLDADGLRMKAVGVPHGIVPALGLVVSVGGARIAFTGDQRMDEARFRSMAEGADLVVAHHAIPQGASGAARELHATPEAIGRLAAETGAAELALSHHMARSLARRQQAREIIEERYDGPVTFASDLDCLKLR